MRIAAAALDSPPNRSQRLLDRLQVDLNLRACWQLADAELDMRQRWRNLAQHVERGRLRARKIRKLRIISLTYSPKGGFI